MSSERVTTIHGTPPDKIEEVQKNPTGQHADYLILTEEERAKGFVRPVRRSYKHVGLPLPKAPLRDLTPEEHERFDDHGYVKFEDAHDDLHPYLGRFWTQQELDKINKGCGTITTMSAALAETYARDPNFYGSTFCAGCQTHIRVGETGEFVWEGTDERVGT